LRVTPSRSSASASSSWPFRTTTIRHGTSKSFVSKNKKQCVFVVCCHMQCASRSWTKHFATMKKCREGMSFEWLMDGRRETMSIWRVSWIHSCKYVCLRVTWNAPRSLNREEEQQMQYHHQEETGGILVGNMEMTMLSTLSHTGVSFSPTTTAHWHSRQYSRCQVWLYRRKLQACGNGNVFILQWMACMHA
jgi:hypothetical protein